MRKRRRKRLQQAAQPEMANEPSGLKELPQGKTCAEMDGNSDPVEIDSRTVLAISGPTVELDASRIQRQRIEETAAN